VTEAGLWLQWDYGGGPTVAGALGPQLELVVRRCKGAQQALITKGFLRIRWREFTLPRSALIRVC
jgi:hypothetical protein